jgi:ABC-type branched-subunit amino acid transport system ATPase component
LGLAQEEVKPIKIPEKLLVKLSVHKNIDLGSYVGGDTRDKKKKVYTYPQLHEM